METEQSDHRGSISPNFEVNFVNGHGALEILVILTPRSVLLIGLRVARVVWHAAECCHHEAQNAQKRSWRL